MRILLLVFVFIGTVSAQTGHGLNIESFSRWEFRTAPIALLANWYTLDISYRVSENVATGPAGILCNGSEMGHMFLPSYRGQAIGWQAYYYFYSILKNTWYLGMRGYQESYSSYPHGDSGYDKLNGFRSNIALGYQMKHSKVTTLLGLGVDYRDYMRVEYKESNHTDLLIIY